LYELKLLRYYDLSAETWFVIILSFISFHLGVFFYFSLGNVNKDIGNSQEELSSDSIFYRQGQLLYIVIIITGLIGLLGALQQWNFLIHKFGSIQKVLLSAYRIYKMRIEGEIQGIAYLPAFAYVSLFFAAIYSAYKKKIALISLLPFSAIILKDLANVGRVFMLFGLIEFTVVFIVASYGFNIEKSLSDTHKKSYFFRFILIIAILVLSASFVRSIRGSIEQYKSASSSIRGLNLFDVITPSVYLYFSSDVGVLNSYLEHNNEEVRFGENTFMPIYSFLAKFNLVTEPNTYQKGYYIPMWTNTGTYLRELHADFGVLGIIFGPFILSFLATLFWFRFFSSKSMMDLILYSYINIIILFSFLMMVTRLGNWVIGLILTILFYLIMERIGHALKNNYRSR